MSGPTGWNPAPPGTAAGAPLPHTPTHRADPRTAVSRPPDLPDAGPAATAAGGAGEQLKEQLHRELAQRLSERLHSNQAPTPAPGQARWTGAAQRAAAETILAEAAEEHARHQLTRGEQMLAPEAEQQVITAVLEEVCGPDGLEPLLRNPDLETININGDCVFVRYVDGRRAQLPSVAGSDAELIQLIRSLAARSGAHERRFDRGSPSVSFQLPSGERVVAVMAVSARPSVTIRRRPPERLAGRIAPAGHHRPQPGGVLGRGGPGPQERAGDRGHRDG
ncbi:hypothetical protein ABZ916_24500 [Streptomyces sp. NPDC046853]|uniref:hypothetical protein n=1 Tax=Streptomyces sp. NPDC046853 TaxID=3154920 RepID=UPI0033C7C9CE